MLKVSSFGVYPEADPTVTTERLQYAVSEAVYLKQQLVFDAGRYEIDDSVVVGGKFSFVGEPGFTEIHSHNLNGPIFDLQINATTERFCMKGIDFYATFDASVDYANSSAIQISGNGSSYFQWGAFKDLSFNGVHSGFRITKDTRTTAYGEECNVAWNEFAGIVAKNRVNTTVYRNLQHIFNFTNGSGTGNYFLGVRGAGDVSIWRYAGEGCVVGDVIISTGQGIGTGSTAGVLVEEGTIYHNNLSVASFGFDAGCVRPFVLPDGHAGIRLSACNTGGYAEVGEHCAPLEGDISDLGTKNWTAGVEKTNVSAGATVGVFAVEIGPDAGVEVEIVVGGMLQGVGAGSTKARFLLNSSSTVSCQQIEDSRFPTGGFGVSVSLSGLTATFSVVTTGSGSSFKANVRVTNGPAKVVRL